MEHSDSDSFQDSMRPAPRLDLNNTRSQPDPSRSNSLMSETSSQPDIHPFFKVNKRKKFDSSKWFAANQQNLILKNEWDYDYSKPKGMMKPHNRNQYFPNLGYILTPPDGRWPWILNQMSATKNTEKSQSLTTDSKLSAIYHRVTPMWHPNCIKQLAFTLL